MVIGIAVAGLLMLWGRAFYGSAEAYRQGEESLQQNRWTQAITYFDRAIHWYAPFNPYIEKSAQKLWNLSAELEREGDHTLAVAALTSLKSGYVAASGLFTPGRDWIKRCEDRIEFLCKHDSRGGQVATEQHKEKGLQTTAAPSLLWTFVLEIGLLGWISWILWMIVCYRKEERALTIAVKWGGPVFLFYALWILGMTQA
jgi:hypothetical protein